MGESLFLTGKAGTGKSTLVEHIVAEQTNRRRGVVVCAPTGVAALNVGGATMHRTFGLPLSVIEPYRGCHDKGRLKTLSQADVIVVDEISMCRQDLFTAMMNTLERASHMRKAHRHKQLLLVGDFHQLPPVLTPREESLYRNFYDGLYPFQGDAWRSAGIRTAVLTENMRQKDARLMEMLDNIRDGRADFAPLESRTVAAPDPDAISLCTTNRRAEEINALGLGRLTSRSVTFRAETKGDVGEGDRPVSETLTLKVGARVMSVVNAEDGDSYGNGSLGTVVDISESEGAVAVRFDHSGNVHTVKAHTWDVYDYRLENTSIQEEDMFGSWASTTVESVAKRKIGSYCQLPLKPAWAVTVHKSQGQTYDRVNIYAGDRFFAPGQLYVALSRCRTLDGMNIVGHLSPASLITDPDVAAFMAAAGSESPTTLF